MFFLYSIIYTLGFIILSPRFLFDAVFSGKYAAGFKERLGFIPRFDGVGKRVVWLHCVSVGEVNAARPLALRLSEQFPGTSLVVSTTTRAGQELARDAFADNAGLIFYFPFDWRSTVRRAMARIEPSAVLLTETELWPNFIREAHKAGARVAIINGRLSARSFERYGKIKSFIKRTLGYLDLALMQENADAKRIMALGLRGSKVRVTGNLKFDHVLADAEDRLTVELRDRFGISPDAPLIIAASTHSPEEEWLLAAFTELWKTSGAALPRIMIAPRHPERFDDVVKVVSKTGFTWVRRSEAPSPRDRQAEVILLDSIGELRAAYALAELVFVGGSLIEHGGQSIFEPAAAGRAILTGPHTKNFAAAVAEFLDKGAIVQLPPVTKDSVVPALANMLGELLSDDLKREQLGANALMVMQENAGAVDRTLEYLRPLFSTAGDR